MQDRDRVHLGRALELARLGWGRVAPNPMVGAVVVRDGTVVGEGHHAEFGAPHAEVVALSRAGDAARGSTLYVNLEPCHHRGKTGPCSLAIRQAGVRRVVCGVADTNPHAAGGAAWLRTQGVDVTVGVCDVAAADLNAIHLSAPERERPFVALKYAISLDARLSERSGRPTRVTRGAAVVEAHRLRAGHDAVMVGIGTVLADDPLLTVREWQAPHRPPLRVVLDSELRVPPESQLARGEGAAPVRIFAAEGGPSPEADATRGANVKVVRVRRGAGGLDLAAVMTSLYEAGVDSVLCEGGGRLGSALLNGGLVDRMYLFVAPRLFGEAGVAAFQGDLGASGHWRLIERSALDDVTLISLAPGAAGDEL